MPKKRNQKGVTVVEYAIMLALIAIAVAVEVGDNGRARPGG